MDKKVKEVVESSLCLPMEEKDAKRIFEVYNKLLLKSSNPQVKKLGEYGSENLDKLAKEFVKQRCEDILENESNK